MNTRSMEYIAAIASEGNLSHAAVRLGVSQPTLSTFLSGLENQLGVDLFMRDKKRLILTPAGKIYLDAAKRILMVKDQTYQSIHRLTHDATETITIGVTPLRGSIVTAQIFPQFSRMFPNVRLDLHEAYMTELRNLVKSGTVNYSLGSCYDIESPDFDYIIISKEEIVLGVPSFHPLASLASSDTANLTSIDISHFADSPFVLLSPGATIRSISDNLLSKEKFQPTVVFETNNNLVVSNMIRQGAGVGFLPRSAIVADAKDIVYFSLSTRYYLNLCIILGKNRVLTEAERYFAYLLIQRDIKNPLYIASPNALAREILQEFKEKEGRL